MEKREKTDSTEDKSKITTNEAARIIGCSPQQVRTLARKGKLIWTKKESARNPKGYDMRIDKKDAERYAKTVPKQGWPRGVKRR